MIETVQLIDDLTRLTKENQSGFDSGTDYTGFINIVQYELSQYLYSLFEVNQNAVDLAAPITVTQAVSSGSGGIIPYPEGYNHLLSIQYVKSANVLLKVQRVGINQLAIINRIPQRRANLTKDRILYSFDKDGIHVQPAQALNFKIVYFKYPPDAKIAYTYTEVNGEAKRTVDTANTVDLVWGMNCYSLILYMVMDKMGISHRDEILNEYARLGIAKEEVKPIN